MARLSPLPGRFAALRIAACLGACWSLPGTAAQPAASPVRIGYRASDEALAPLTVRFWAQLPAGSTVVWTFGDGATGSGATADHIYYRPGTYHAAATIRDVRGRITDTGDATVTVKSAGPEHAALTLLFAPGGIRLSEAGSVSYTPHTARYWLDGQEVPLSRTGSTIKTELVALAPGTHRATVRIGSAAGELEKTLTFRSAAVTTSAPFEVEVLRLTNAARAAGFNCQTLKAGGKALPPLTRDPTLDSAAVAQSIGLAVGNYFAHQSAIDGSQPFERVAATGLVVSSSAENIAAGQPTPQGVVDAWLRSPGHCKNIMGDFTHIGLSYVNRPGSTYNPAWTQVFAKP